jgi:nucleotide-binding universal stress UspA family protein
MAKKILVALDGSPSSDRARDLAIQLATNTAAKLLVLTVASDDPLTEAEVDLALHRYQPEVSAVFVEPAFATGPEQGCSALERAGQVSSERNASIRKAMGQHVLAEAEAAAKQKGFSPVETLLRSGDPATIILATAAAESPDLLVIGSRGLSNRLGTLMGSVSYRVARQAECSVITVRTPDMEDETDPPAPDRYNPGESK